MGFIDISELVEKVLLYLNTKSFLSLLSMNLFLNSFRQNQVLWKQKVQDDFAVVEHKTNSLSFRKQYLSLMKPYSTDSTVIDNRIDKLALLHLREKLNFDFAKRRAIACGNIEMAS